MPTSVRPNRTWTPCALRSLGQHPWSSPRRTICRRDPNRAASLLAIDRGDDAAPRVLELEAVARRADGLDRPVDAELGQDVHAIRRDAEEQSLVERRRRAAVRR